MKRYFSKNKFALLCSFAALLTAWLSWTVAHACVKNEYIIPSFWASALEFFALFTQGYFYKSLLSTLIRSVVALAISFLLGAFCAVLGAIIKPFAYFFKPVISVVRALPTLAVLIIILIWLTPRTAPVAVAALVLFPVSYTQFAQAIDGVDKDLLQMAKVFELSKKSIIKSIYIPSVAPSAVKNAGANLSFAIKLIISAEVMAATYTSLGGMMAEAQAYINLPRLAALTVCAVIFGLLFEGAFALAARLIFKNRGEAEV